MNAQILRLVFKKYWNNQRLTTFESSALEYYLHSTIWAEKTSQEIDYINKIKLATF